MRIMIPLALFGWPVLALVLFSLMPARRAVLYILIGGWLFLPMSGYALPGLPDYGKVTAASLSALLGVVVFDGAKLGTFRFRWFDIPVLLWCLVPIPSAMTAGIGAYHGASASLDHFVAWGVPYVLGRLYFTDAQGMRDLAMGVFIGGVIYAPLCLIESIKGPYLHFEVYGFMQHTSLQAWRYGGWRPMVFMQHGLATGFWMATAAAVGLWLWWSGAVRRLWGFPMLWYVAGVWLVAILCRSTGAWALLVFALAVTFTVRYAKLRWGLVALVVLTPLYIAGRATGTLSQETLTGAAGMVFPESRIASWRARLMQEDTISVRAWNRPIFGWGPWGDYRMGEGWVRAVDSLWIIMFGKYGWVGLSALVTTILLPAGLWAWRVRPKVWFTPQFATAGAMALILPMYMIDCLSNAMANPTFMLVAGGLGPAAILAGKASKREADHIKGVVYRHHSDSRPRSGAATVAMVSSYSEPQN